MGFPPLYNDPSYLPFFKPGMTKGGRLRPPHGKYMEDALADATSSKGCGHTIRKTKVYSISIHGVPDTTSTPDTAI